MMPKGVCVLSFLSVRTHLVCACVRCVHCVLDWRYRLVSVDDAWCCHGARFTLRGWFLSQPHCRVPHQRRAIETAQQAAREELARQKIRKFMTMKAKLAAAERVRRERAYQQEAMRRKIAEDAMKIEALADMRQAMYNARVAKMREERIELDKWRGSTVFEVCGLWFVVLWFVVCGLWFVVCGLWFVACRLWFVMCGL